MPLRSKDFTSSRTMKSNDEHLKIYTYKCLNFLENLHLCIGLERTLVIVEVVCLDIFVKKEK